MMLGRRKALVTIAAMSAAPGMVRAQAPAANAPIPRDQVAPGDAPAQIVIGKDEKAPRLVVTGQVTDGSAYLPGVSIYAYYADSKGLYGPAGSSGDHAANSRLRGLLRSDAHGYYGFESSIPGSYGGPQHLHYVISAPGYRNRRIETWLEGEGLYPVTRDPYPRYPNPDYLLSIKAATCDAKGIWHVTQDIVLVKS